jgi:hypothetical protein
VLVSKHSGFGVMASKKMLGFRVSGFLVSKHLGFGVMVSKKMSRFRVSGLW